MGTKTKIGCLKEVYGGVVKDDQMSKKYMGLLVQHDGKFSEQVEVAAKKLQLASFEIITTIVRMGGFPYSAQLKLYLAKARSKA